MPSIDGISSGLDISGMVNAIIEAESGPVNLLRDRRTETTNKATTYKAISAKMVALSANLSTLNKASTFEQWLVSSSNEDVLTAVASSGTAPGSYTVNIEQLARAHQIASRGFADADTTSIGVGTVEISLGDGSVTTLTVEAGSDSLIGLKDLINEANLDITASVVDDGTANNAFRLVLAANITGVDNQITLTSNLTGGRSLDFGAASFDTVETSGLSSATTSAISLGTSAAYTGTENKTYTFTIGSGGTQTIGSGSITIDYTDGTNTGSFTVDAADTEIVLGDAWADGLTLSFGAGDLSSGDTFNVQTFASTLQVAADAKVSLGSTDGGGSPIVVSSSTNQVADIVPGVTLDLKSTSLSPVTINISRDKATIKSSITAMLSAYNDVMTDIDEQFNYDPDTGKGGVLLGDTYLMAIQSTLRDSATGAISALPASMNMLRAIGVTPGDNGTLNLTDPQALYDALDNDPAAVVSLFTRSAVSSNSLVNFVAATGKTVATVEGYEVDITQAATQGYMQGAKIYDPATQALVIDSTNKNLQVTLDGVKSDLLTLTEKTYTSGTDLAGEIQAKIDADEAIGKYGLEVEWVNLGDGTGYVKMTSPSYGSSSQVSLDVGVENGAAITLGLSNATLAAGLDVAGTINGETATGNGRVLTGDEGNQNTEGLKLEILLTAADLGDGPESTVTFAEGFAARIDRVLDSLNDSIDGSLTYRSKGLQKQIDDYAEQIADYEKRLLSRRKDLFAKFQAMEQTLSELQNTGSYLESQIAQVSNNWN